MPTELHTLSLCAGGGGLDLGLSLALGRTRCVCWVEWEAFAVEILASRMEAMQMAPAPLYSDLRSFDGKPWRGCVDIVAAGYPCQPFSLAGKRRGSDDPRHLWPHVRRVVGEVEPPICFFENVSGHLSLGFGEVTRDLEAMGYAVAAGLFTAAEVGASHKRERLFILAVVNHPRIGRGEGWPESVLRRGGSPVALTSSELGNPDRSNGQGRGTAGLETEAGLEAGHSEVAHAHQQGPQGWGESQRERADQFPVRSGRSIAERPFPPGPAELDAWQAVLAEDDSRAPAQSKVRLLADGVASDRPRQLKLLGNGVVPLQAAYAFCSLWSALRFN